jgi:hypothetical protein
MTALKVALLVYLIQTLNAYLVSRVSFYMKVLAPTHALMATTEIQKSINVKFVTLYAPLAQDPPSMTVLPVLTLLIFFISLWNHPQLEIVY